MVLAAALLPLACAPLASTPPPVAERAPAARTGQHADTLETRLVRPVSLRYLLHLPRDYGQDTTRRWPLILYLHGGSLRGESVDTVRVWGLPRRADREPDLPFIVVSPQTPRGTLWTDTEALVALLDHVAARHAVDPDRVYLTGHSMGGNGAWYLAYRHPERFAAIAPMSAPANPWWAGRLAATPTWVFHGAQDSVVPLRESEEMVGALRRQGNERVRFSVLPHEGHGIVGIYEEAQGRALLDWFLEHRRR